MEALGLMAMKSPLFLSRASPSPTVEKSPLKLHIRATFPKRKGDASPKQPSAAVAVIGNAVTQSPVSPPQSSEPLLIPPLRKASPDDLQYPPGYLGAVPDRTAMGDGGDGTINAMGYLTNIISTKVYDVAMETPLQLAPKLSERWGVNVWLKREDLQPVFSFKLRGAYNMMAKLPIEKLDRGVICSSAGNHAQGVALAAKKLNCNAVIVMPVTTPEIKWRSVEQLGATVVLVGDSYDEAQAYAKKQGENEGRTFIPPFDHPDVIMGQGTVGMEIVRQAKGPIHAIFIPVGGGGLIAGIAAYVKRVSPQVKIIGVEPSDANAMALSLHHGERVVLDQLGGFADGVAVKVVGEETFRLCTELVDGVVLVNRDAICASIKDMFEEKRNILEPAGALALAGAEAYCKYYGLKGKNFIAITSGANMNFDKLRVVTELANVGRRQEAVLATVMPEKPGSFKRFCELVGSMNITEFKYRCSSDKEAVVLYGVGVHTIWQLKEMQGRMEAENLKTYDFTRNDLVKDHLRYLMGGRPNLQNEVLCRFIFPEKPGALMKFLDVVSPRWNITLFHYRGQGETGANVLVAIQVPDSEMNEFKQRASDLGYDYEVVVNDDAFRLLMHF
ncbi:hypothetical protein SAY86_023869 [Trapa natans]|uniref:Threonine dehydratase n=1 Tax=Trapa natans TaxID=22666 RepID=A0AAN7LWH4_TRANT|nr:hypothetical protein SAY86_023869 [Trapa natans]